MSRRHSPIDPDSDEQYKTWETRHHRMIRIQRVRELLREQPYADSVDVRLVASEGLSAHSFSDVPELGGGIAGSRHKQPGVGRQREAHYITGVTGERSRLLTSLDVPQSAAREQKANEGGVGLPGRLLLVHCHYTRKENYV